MGWKRVAAAAGVGSSTVYPILYGKHVHKRTHPEHRPRRVKVRRDIAERLLAVTADIAPGARVEAIGTQRRIQAMTAAGWSLSWQAKSLGRTTSNYAGILTRSRCEKTTADQVADLYHQVGDRQPAPSGGSTRARRHAERHGWAPAAGWTAETIDDPKTPALPLDPESVAARARATSWGAA